MFATTQIAEHVMRKSIA